MQHPCKQTSGLLGSSTSHEFQVIHSDTSTSAKNHISPTAAPPLSPEPRVPPRQLLAAGHGNHVPIPSHGGYPFGTEMCGDVGISQASESLQWPTRFHGALSVWRFSLEANLKIQLFIWLVITKNKRTREFQSQESSGYVKRDNVMYMVGTIHLGWIRKETHNDFV